MDIYGKVGNLGYYDGTRDSEVGTNKTVYGMAPEGSQTQSVATPTVDTDASKKDSFSYVEMLQKLSPYTPMSEEEKKKAERDEKRTKTFSAIGDAIGALANLYGAANGATNAYDSSTSMYGKAGAYYEKLNKERKENQDRYTQLMLQAMRMDQDKENNKFNRDMALRQFDLSKDKFEYDKMHAGRQFTLQQDRFAHEKSEAEKAWAFKNNQAEMDQDRFNFEKQKYADQQRILHKPIEFNINGNKVKIAMSELDDITIARLYGMLPEEVRNRYETYEVFSDEYGKTKTTTKNSLLKPTDMGTAVAMYYQQSPELMSEIARMAGLKKSNQTNGKEKVEGF